MAKTIISGIPNVFLALLVIAAVGWQQGWFGAQAVTGGAQQPGVTATGTFDVQSLGTGVSEVDGKSAQITVAGGTPTGQTTDVFIRMEQSLKTTTGDIKYVGGSCQLYDAGTKGAIGGAMTVLDTGTSSTSDPAVGQSIYALCTNASNGPVKVGPFTVGGATTSLRAVVDVYGVPILMLSNASGVWAANINESIGALETSNTMRYYLSTTTAQGKVINPHLSISADMTSNYTSWVPTGATEVKCPLTQTISSASQELKCFDLHLGNSITAKANGQPNTFSIISFRDASDALGTSVAVVVYDAPYYVQNGDLVASDGADNTNTAVGAADDTGLVGVI